MNCEGSGQIRNRCMRTSRHRPSIFMLARAYPCVSRCHTWADTIGRSMVSRIALPPLDRGTRRSCAARVFTIGFTWSSLVIAGDLRAAPPRQTALKGLAAELNRGMLAAVDARALLGPSGFEGFLEHVRLARVRPFWTEAALAVVSDSFRIDLRGDERNVVRISVREGAVEKGLEAGVGHDCARSRISS